MALQSRTTAVGNLQDDTSGNNYSVNKAFYVLKLDKTLAQIYSAVDSSFNGTTPIIQDGVNNVTNSRGEFTYWVEAGDYIERVGANERRVSITGADYFNNRIEETENSIIDAVAGRGAYYPVGSFEAGFTYTDINQVGTFGTAPNITYYVYTGGKTNLPHPVTAGTDPTASPLYEKVTYNEAASIANANGGSAQNRFDLDDLDTVSDMLAYDYTGLPEDTPVKWGGYYSKGDGGGNSGLLKFGAHTGDGGSIFSIDANTYIESILDFVSPSLFGVVEGLDSGNADRIESMIATGLPVQWGEKSHGVTRALGGGSTLIEAINWESSGCEIFYDPSGDHIQSLIHYAVLPLSHRIQGQLTFNANFNANRGLWLENKSTASYPTGFGKFYSDGLSANQIRRLITFSGGEGLIIEGSFTSVVMENSVVKDCRMAPDAGISGSQGIAGISVVRDAIGGYPTYVKISNPEIVDIKSEDLDYKDDQDGIKIFGGITSGDEASFAHVVGGTFRNCFGRSIKCQTSDGLVEGVTFLRDDGLNGGYGNDEVAFLYGGGTVKDIQCHYDGFAPDKIVAMNSSSVDNLPAGQIKGIKATLRGGIALPRVFDYFARKAQAGDALIADIEVLGVSVGEIGVIRVADDTTNITIRDVTANLTNQGFSVLATAGSNQSARIDVQNVRNLGADVPLYRHRVSGEDARAIVNSIGSIVGFSSSGGAIDSTSTNAPIVQLCDKIQGNYDRAGSLKFNGGRVGGSSEFRTPILSTSNVAMMSIMFSGVENTIAIISTSNAGISILVGGAGLTNGNTANPGTGNYRIWVDTATNELVFFNNTGTTRSLTVTNLGY